MTTQRLALLMLCWVATIWLPATDIAANPVVQRIHETLNQEIIQAQIKALKNLRKLQETFTTRGDIDKALLIKAMAERIEAEMPAQDVLGNPVAAPVVPVPAESRTADEPAEIADVSVVEQVEKPEGNERIMPDSTNDPLIGIWRCDGESVELQANNKAITSIPGKYTYSGTWEYDAAHAQLTVIVAAGSRVFFCKDTFMSEWGRPPAVIFRRVVKEVSAPLRDDPVPPVVALPIPSAPAVPAAGMLARRMAVLSAMRAKTYTGIIATSETIGGLIVFSPNTKAQGGVQLTIQPGSLVIFQTDATEIPLINAGGSTDPIFLVFSKGMYWSHKFADHAKGFTDSCVYIAPDIDFGFTKEPMRSCLFMSPSRLGERTRVLYRGPTLVNSVMVHGSVTADTMNALDTCALIDCEIEPKVRQRPTTNAPKQVWDVGGTFMPSLVTAFYTDTSRWSVTPAPGRPTGLGITDLDALYQLIDTLRTRYSLEFRR